MEQLPDLATLSDEDLKKLIDELTRDEHKASYQRRLLHGKIDILRAELVWRLQGGSPGDSSGSPVPRRPRGGPPRTGAATVTPDHSSDGDDPGRPVAEGRVRRGG